MGPAAHTHQLDALRPLMKARATLFLGYDDFVNWELRGVPLTLPEGTIQGAKPAARVSTRRSKDWHYGDQFDFDSIGAAALDGVDLVLIPRSRYQSEPPPNFHLVRQTASYELWKRRGPTPARRTLAAETDAPGAVLRCNRARGRALSRRVGWARIWRSRPVIVRFPRRLRITIPASHPVLPLVLPRGRWELGLNYNSPVDMTVNAAGKTFKMPSNLDRPGPHWRVGDVSDRVRGITFNPNGRGPFSAPNRVLELMTMTAVRSDTGRELVPLRRACGRYVDWYTLGAWRLSALASLQRQALRLVDRHGLRAARWRMNAFAGPVCPALVVTPAE